MRLNPMNLWPMNLWPMNLWPMNLWKSPTELTVRFDRTSTTKQPAAAIMSRTGWPACSGSGRLRHQPLR